MASRNVHNQTLNVLPNSFGELLNVLEGKNEFKGAKEGFSKHFKEKDERVKNFCFENNRRNLKWQKFNNKYSVKEGFSKHFKKKDERVKIFCVENNRRNLNWQKFSNN